jgi:ATP-dependent DNA helicase RecG
VRVGRRRCGGVREGAIISNRTLIRAGTNNGDRSTRDSLDFDPISIEGCAYEQIHSAVDRTIKLIESIKVSTPEGLEKVTYPSTALHEIITNAVLHRDYSTADDVHVKIFDKRVEVASPGTLPGHVTPENILRERFARNGVIVRLINKFPNPPNKDVGEGLNTAFSAMRTMNLKDPVVTKDEETVTVVLKHEPLATPEEIIIDFCRSTKQSGIRRLEKFALLDQRIK